MVRRLAWLLAAALTSPAAAEPDDCIPNGPPVSAAPAAQPMRLNLEERGQLTVLRAEGMIDRGAAERLSTLLHPGVDEVWFDSPGGDIREALLMGRAIRAVGALTRVTADRVCIGACAEAFLGGIGRVVDAGGLLGFTAVPLSDPASSQTQAEREQAAARWAEERADYYIRAGISRGLLRLQLDTPAPGICYLSEAGMRRYNVTNFPQFRG
jgi:hypothetical protein